MNEIAEALGAELAEISDGVDRSGRLGYIRAGMEAMRRSTHPLRPIHTQRPLHEYRLVGYACLGRTVRGTRARLSQAPRPGAEPRGLCADPRL